MKLQDETWNGGGERRNGSGGYIQRAVRVEVQRMYYPWQLSDDIDESLA